MLRVGSVVGLVAGLVMVTGGCVGTGKTAAPTPASIPVELSWAASEPVFIVVDKKCGRLDVFNRGRRWRSYEAVFGSGGRGPKRYEGDRRTPLGLYSIVYKRRHARWSRFLLLDYPNPDDVARYRGEVQRGFVPERGDSSVGIGSQVGIHGSDKPDMNASHINWTHGCISIANADVEELYRIAPEGTFVLIRE